MPLPVSLIVHTRNSAATLPRLLATTAWIEDRIIVDMESHDATAHLAQSANCRVVTIAPVDVVDSVRNAQLPLAENDWILVLDSDEYLATDAEQEVARLIGEAHEDLDAFAIPRYNTIAGQVMLGCGWYPDHQTRLFRRGSVAWQNGHHRPVLLKGGTNRLKQLTPPHCLHIHHDNYDSLAELIERQVKYALTDEYSDAFDFHTYLKSSYEEFERRFDTTTDGDLAAALAIVMSWDRLIRGVLHWEKTGRTGPLDAAFTLPIVADMSVTKAAEFAALQARLAAMESSTSWRMTAPLRRVVTIVRAAFGRFAP